MIASPSDLVEARDAVEQALHDWNDANARSRGVVLHPWRWETSSVPVAGGPPQSIINAQGVDDSDIMFALFWGRLGSPTPDAVSGTAEEIDRALSLGKRVHVYFSKAALPNDVDTVQLDALRAFRKEMESRALLGYFSSSAQLTHEVWKAIEHDLADNPPVHDSDLVTPPIGVEFLVQPVREREVSGYSRDGSPRYTTKTRVDITNTGGLDAEQVTLTADAQSGLIRLLGADGPTTIHKGQSRSYPLVLSSGVSGAAVTIRWVEDGQSKDRTYQIG